MNERIKELRKQVDVDMHLHNLEDFRAMSGCFGLEGGNKIVDDYIEKFAELIVKECVIRAEREWIRNGSDTEHNQAVSKVIESIKQHFGVEK